jgi:hypothetical protein
VVIKMSASQCIKCERIVGGYEKYCDNCVKTYGVKQDEVFHKNHWFNDWETERKMEFEKDLAAVPAARPIPAPQLRKTIGEQLLPLTRLHKSGKNSQPDYRKRFGSKPKKKNKKG